MKRSVSDVAFTPSVKAVQERLGSRKSYARFEQRDESSDVITPELAAFIAERDSIYLGTASADGRPYIQHRGGPRGFLKVLDDHTLAVADYAGNQQYVSMGNLADNDRAFLFLMDYANRRRIKIWGRATFVEDDPRLLESVFDADYGAAPQRVLRFTVEAWDVNCPQHIPRLLSEDEVADREAELRARIAELESENAELRG